jgi:hypothetical protein
LDGLDWNKHVQQGFPPHSSVRNGFRPGLANVRLRLFITVYGKRALRQKKFGALQLAPSVMKV